MQINDSLRSFLSHDVTKGDIEVAKKQEKKKDSISISNTSKAFSKLNDFMNLGKPGRLDLSGLNKEEKEEFLKMLSVLLKKGIVGYEIKEVNGKPEKHYMVNQIGDKRIYDAEEYNQKKYEKRY